MADGFPIVSGADAAREGQPFSMIELTDSQLYWYQVFKTFAPYATVASAVFGAVGLINGLEQTKKLDQIAAELKQIEQSIIDLKNTILNTINYQRMKDLSDSVDAVRKNFADVVVTKSDAARSILGNQCNEYMSNCTDRMADPSISDEYRFAYVGFLSILLPIKLLIDQTYGVDFVGFPGDPTKVIPLLKNDLGNTFIPAKPSSISAARTMGSKRVSGLTSTRTLASEGRPPIFRTVYTFDSDGVKVFAGSWQPPHGSLSDTLNRANALCMAAQTQKTNETAQPFVDAFTHAEDQLAALSG